MPEGDKSKRVRRTSSYSNQKEKTNVAGNAEDGGRQDREHDNTGSPDRRTSSTTRKKDGDRWRSGCGSSGPDNGQDGGKQDRNRRKSGGSPDRRPSSSTRKGDVDHRSTSGRGPHGRGQKRSRSESPEEREARGGEGKTDSGSKKLRVQGVTLVYLIRVQVVRLRVTHVD